MTDSRAVTCAPNRPRRPAILAGSGWLWLSGLLACLLGLLPRPAAAEPLTVWAMGEEAKRLQQMAAGFEREVPGTRVRVQAIPWDAAEAKLLTAVVGGSPPDLAQLGTTYIPKFAAMGALVPLDQELSSWGAARRADFFPGPLAAATVEGKLYGIPWYIDTWVLFYRTDLLAAAGITRPPASWTELQAAARRLRADLDGDGRPDRYGIALSSSDAALLAVLAAQAGGFVLEGNRIGVQEAGFREALRFFLSFFEEGLAPRGEGKDTNLYQAFEQGLYPMLISGPFMLALIDKECPRLRGRWSVAPLPRGKHASSFVGGSALSVFRASRQQPLARRFIEYLSRTENQVAWYGASRTLPPTRSAWANDLLRGDPRVAVFGEQLTSARPPPPIPEWEEIRDKLGRDYLEKLVYGTLQVEAALPALEQDITHILGKRHRASQQSGVWKVGSLLVVGLGLLLLIGWLLARRSRRPAEPGGLDVRDLPAARRVPYLFLLPALAVLAVFLFLPILASFLMSLTDWNIYAIESWGRISVTGLANYRMLMSDPIFWRSLLNTFLFVIFGVPLSIAASLLAALGLNQAFLRGKSLLRTAYFMPVVTTMVAVAVVWRWLYNPRLGLINHLLELVGIPGQDWLASPRLALPALIVMAVWKNFGYNMIIFVAGLQAIPEMYYEAARIDGASGWRRFRHITLPLLTPTMYFVTVMTVIGYFQFFAEPYVMTGGGPLHSTLSVVLYMYNHGFRFYNLGYASAIAFVLFAFISLFTLGQQHLQRRIRRVY